jgi:ankyrin repeat domain-containing protein 50
MWRHRFLHATLLIENVRYCTSVKKIMERLEQLPEGLDALYAETFRRIEAQPAERAAIALRVLSWLVYAKEPLDIEDMIYAVADDPENDWLDPSNLVDEALLVSVCCGLVLVEDYSDPEDSSEFECHRRLCS